jgi:regulation of enolase protein 1 (concanavalin A-like superfamily)
VSASWSRLYDQGGLIFVLRDGTDTLDQKWVKTGIEFYNGAAYVSTVAADRWADWSLVQVGIREGKVTLEIEREEKDDTLWIFVVDEEGKRVPVREVTWVLSEPEERECWVGVYTAMPKADGRDLEVKFEGWELEVRE